MLWGLPSDTDRVIVTAIRANIKVPPVDIIIESSRALARPPRRGIREDPGQWS